MSSRRPDWRREESRFVDGEAGVEETRRLEARRRADPELAHRLDEWEETADLWRDDARRRAAGIDPENLADRVLARVSGGTSPADVAPTTAPRAYAAAALVLIGIGLAGSLAVGSLTPAKRTEDVGDSIRAIERARLDLQADLELELLAPKGDR